MTGTILRLASVFFILVVGLLSFTTFKNSNNLHGKSPATVSASESAERTYEYRVLDGRTPEHLAAQANQLASESWEMIDIEQDVADGNHHWVGLLKRAKR